MAKKFRFPADATAMTDVGVTAPGITHDVRLVVQRIGAMFSDRDRALEDYLNGLKLGSGFPLVNNDGTQTQSVIANDPSRPGQILLQVVDNANPFGLSTVLDFATSSGSITTVNGGEAQLSWFAAPSGPIRAEIAWRLSGALALDVSRTATAQLQIGVLGAVAVPRQVVTGSRGGNAALASLLTAMAAFGWIVDSSTP